MIGLAAVGLATAIARPVPASFDLASYNRVQEQSEQNSLRRRYLPADPALPSSGAQDFSLRWKLNKVKLKMALDLPY